MAILGCVGDLHEPFCHPMYRRFVMDTFERFRVDKTHFVGDITDNHAISYHESDPDGHSAGKEGDLAERGVEKWYRTFPHSTVSIGNHDALPHRKNKTSGTPRRFVREYSEAWKTPNWKWDFTHEVDKVLLEHGTAVSGKDAALNLAVQKRSSIVIGHIHSNGGVKYQSNDYSRIFGMSAGCGIDCRSYAFEYGRAFPLRPVLGCGIVIHGDLAIFVPMPCGVGERYHRSRAPKRGRRRGKS